MLRKHLSKLDPNLRITFSGHNLNNKFFSKLKDPIPLGKSSGLVYQVPCKNCDKVYIGETMQLLKNRLAQHENDVKYKRKSTALCEHTTETGHCFDFGKATIVCFEEKENKRKVRETIEIIKNKDTAVNFKTDYDKLSNMYSPVVSARKRNE